MDIFSPDIFLQPGKFSLVRAKVMLSRTSRHNTSTLIDMSNNLSFQIIRYISDYTVGRDDYNILI